MAVGIHLQMFAYGISGNHTAPIEGRFPHGRSTFVCLECWGDVQLEIDFLMRKDAYWQECFARLPGNNPLTAPAT